MKHKIIPLFIALIIPLAIGYALGQQGKTQTDQAVNPTGSAEVADHKLGAFTFTGGSELDLSSDNYSLAVSVGQKVSGSSSSTNYSTRLGFLTGTPGGQMCDCGDKGDMDGNGNANPVDVAYLVSYVYRSLDALVDPPNCPYATGDLDCSGGPPNPVDVAYLVNYVYKTLDAICDGCNQPPS